MRGGPLRGPAGAVLAEHTSWTPDIAFGGVVADLGGEGAEANGDYDIIGGRVFGRLHLQFGDTPTIGTGTLSFLLPVAPVGAVGRAYPVGSGTVFGADGERYNLEALWIPAVSATRAVMVSNDAIASDAAPLTWAALDEFIVGFSGYRCT